jgi:hypothetical protein
MGFAVGGKRGVVSDPNIVPLIDVLLVLLVFLCSCPIRRGYRRKFRRRAGPRDVRIARETNHR